MEPKWMSTAEAAAVLGVYSRTLYRLVDSGDLPAYRIGRVIRFKREDVDAYIETSRVKPGELAHLLRFRYDAATTRSAKRGAPRHGNGIRVHDGGT